MIREILIWPHPDLKTVAKPIAAFDEATKTLVRDMFETMYAAEGIGLAAPQVGVLQRVLVLDVSPRQDGASALAMINPEIVRESGTQIYREGCLSIPGEFDEVTRAAEVEVRFRDVNGAERSLTAYEVFAVAIQHEIDHLNGVMFVDHLSSIKRELIRRRMKKLKQAARDAAASERLESL